MSTELSTIEPRRRPLRLSQRNRRLCQRVSTRVLAAPAVLHPVGEPDTALTAPLVDVSGSGCCLEAEATTIGHLIVGKRYTVTLPVTGQRLRLPATLTTVDSVRDAPTRAHLRLRFHGADPVSHQRLIRWIGELALHRWQL